MVVGRSFEGFMMVLLRFSRALERLCIEDPSKFKIDLLIERKDRPFSTEEQKTSSEMDN